MPTKAVRATFLVAGLVMLMTSHSVLAQRARRVDGGTFDVPTAPVSTGLTVDFLGASLSTLEINPDGSVTFAGGSISPFQTSSFAAGGTMTTKYMNELTTIPLSAGVDAGFLVNWNYTGADGEGDDSFQLGLYQLSIGGVSSLAVEFNYEQLAFDPGSLPTIGFTVGGTTYDLLEELALSSFSQYGGSGFSADLNADICPTSGSTALACNNFFFDAVNGTTSSALPTFAGGFFSNDNFGYGFAPVGRYLFLFPGATTPPDTSVPEPGTLLLMLGGLGSLLASRVRRRRAV